MLAPYETRLLDTLRALPAERQPVIADACAQMIHLCDRYATCTGPGVDGFSCGNPSMTCEQCHELVHAFHRLAD